MIRNIFLITAVGCLMATQSNAAIVHTDAVGGPSGNTVNAATASDSDWFVAGGNLRDDNLWGERATFGIGGGRVYENWHPSGDHPNAEDDLSADLITTVSGLNPGQSYSVWVDYIRFSAGVADPDGNRGGVEAGLTLSDDMLVFGASTGEDNVVGGSNLNGFVNADRAGLRGYLGVGVADLTGELAVYIGTELPSGVNGERTWYDGVSVEAIPEPTTLLVSLLGLGVPALARRARIA